MKLSSKSLRRLINETLGSGMQKGEWAFGPRAREYDAAVWEIEEELIGTDMIPNKAALDRQQLEDTIIGVAAKHGLVEKQLARALYHRERDLLHPSPNTVRFLDTLDALIRHPNRLLDLHPDELQESSTADAKRFYAKKRDKLLSFLAHLTQAESTLNDVMELDLTSPIGEDPDVKSLMLDLNALRDFGENVLDAVDVMVVEAKKQLDHSYTGAGTNVADGDKVFVMARDGMMMPGTIVSVDHDPYVSTAHIVLDNGKELYFVPLKSLWKKRKR